MKDKKLLNFDDNDITKLIFTHVSLGNIMPFYCCWLDDGDGNPDLASVSIGPAIYSVNNPFNLSTPDKVWWN